MAKCELYKETIKFYCPGCKSYKYIPVKPYRTEHPLWDFNGDFNEPTLFPSILETSHYWDNVKEVQRKRVCHSFVENGMIRYLSDCTHELAGKTVQLPEIVNE